MTELLISAGVLATVLLLVIISRNKYTRWLERRLAVTRKELATLRNDRQQPWLTGATTEYHLQKRIKALEANMPKSVLRRLDHQLPPVDKKIRCPQLEARVTSARALMEKFIFKVDSGQARSKETYAEMKAWLED